MELREAVQANLVTPQTGISSSADGPWTQAMDLGLFSDNNAPADRPLNVPEPEFRLRGVGEAFEGPLKLRELVDLALRKILPADAAVQPADRLEWIPVDHFGILAACLSGELTRNPTFAAPASSPAIAPNVTQADCLSDFSEDIDSILHDHRRSARKNARSANEKPSKPTFKFAYAIGSVTLILLGVLGWWILRPATRTDRNEVIGSWVRIPSHAEGQAFGIAFNEDGTCVVFNSGGSCWSGEFEWLDDPTDAENQTTDATKDTANTPSYHQRDTVLSSDGLIRLNVDSANQPLLGDQPIGECFVRRDGEFLWIGYLANSVDPESRQSLDAEWQQLWPRRRSTDLSRFEAGMQSKDLLARFGVPDEARPMTATEITSSSNRELAQPRSLIRYDTQLFALFADGSVRRFQSP